jgi:predicted nucleotidyltransferase
MDKILTASDVLSPYRATIRARSERDAQALVARRVQALAVAQMAARLLVAEFGATRVVLFGSLAHGRWFSMTSDIDLAAWGLGADAHLLAMARLEDLAGGLPVDLVRSEHCPARLLTVIEAEGVTL